MAETLNRKYPFPERTVTPDVQLDLQRLAEAVDRDVMAVLATLPYRAASLAELNAKSGMRIGDRGIITGSQTANENGEYYYSGTAWKQQNAIIAATLEDGWNGSVQWVRSGSLITVSVNVGRTAGTVNYSAWTGQRIARGLPLPVPEFIAQAPAETNRYEYPAFSAQITNDGNVDLVARWVARELSNGSWARAQFSYREA